jgi:hypothetical protein
MDSTISVMLEFYLYNLNLYQVAEKRIIIEFIETGGFINFEHQIMLINGMLYRSFAQQAQSIIIIVLGLGLFVLSFIDIKNEAKAAAEAAAALAAEEAEGEEGGAPPADAAGATGGPPAEGAPPADGAAKKVEIKEDSPWTLLKNAEGGQKINFANNLMVFIGQIMKNGYDSYASAELKKLASATDYIDMGGLYKMNKFVQLMDSMIICVSSISLLKYTIAAVPELETI